MKKTFIASAAVLASLLTVAAQATCIYPRAPERIPDGNTATYEEMLEGQAAVKQFNEDINSYNACLDMELKSLTESGEIDQQRLGELEAMQVKKHNAAVDEVEYVAGRFNEQLQVFKARDKKKK